MRQQIALCEQLSRLCDAIQNDLSFRVTPATKLIAEQIKDNRFSKLDFISADALVNRKELYTCLTKEENTEIADFLFSLGKTDISTQKSLVSSFKAYINESEKVYKERYKRNSRLIVTLGFSTGLIMALALI